MIVLLMVVAMGVLIFPSLALDAHKAHKVFVQRREAGEWMTVEEENFGMRSREHEALFGGVFLVCLVFAVILCVSILL